MARECFPAATKYRVVPTNGDYSVEVWIPGEPPYAAITVAETEEALAWMVAEQKKSADADRQKLAHVREV